MDTNKNKTGYVWLLVILVLGFFAYAMWRPSATTKQAAQDLEESINQDRVQNQEMDTSTPATDSTAPQDETMVSPGTTEPTDGLMTKSADFTVKANNFAFDMKEIRVKKGDLVKITLDNTEGFHDWKVDEFSAATKVLKVGESETISFVADQAGTFEYYCSVGQHRAMGMKGNLIVE